MSAQDEAKKVALFIETRRRRSMTAGPLSPVKERLYDLAHAINDGTKGLAVLYEGIGEPEALLNQSFLDALRLVDFKSQRTRHLTATLLSLIAEQCSDATLEIRQEELVPLLEFIAHPKAAGFSTPAVNPDAFNLSLKSFERLFIHDLEGKSGIGHCMYGAQLDALKRGRRDILKLLMPFSVNLYNPITCLVFSLIAYHDNPEVACHIARDAGKGFYLQAIGHVRNLANACFGACHVPGTEKIFHSQTDSTPPAADIKDDGLPASAVRRISAATSNARRFPYPVDRVARRVAKGLRPGVG
jgi:hypothetical protein